MQRIHPLSPELGAAARLGVKMVLPLSAHHDFAVLRNLEPLGVGFNCLHK